MTRRRSRSHRKRKRGQLLVPASRLDIDDLYQDRMNAGRSSTFQTRLEDLLDRDSKSRWRIYSISMLLMAFVGFTAETKGISSRWAAFIATPIGVVTLLGQVWQYTTVSSKKAIHQGERRLREVLVPIFSVVATCAVFLTVATVRPSLAPAWYNTFAYNLSGFSTSKRSLGNNAKTRLSYVSKGIDSASSPDELAAALKSVTLELKEQSETGVRIKTPALEDLSYSISKAAQKYPSVPEVWKTASVLVNYRGGGSQASSSVQNSCWNMMRGHWEERDRPLVPGEVWIDDQTMGHCELTLDDGPQFRNSEFGKAYEHNLMARNNVLLRLNVHDAVVQYSGGKLIPFSVLNCLNCTFRMHVTEVPTPAGQRILNTLLTADLRRVDLTGEAE